MSATSLSESYPTLTLVAGSQQASENLAAYPQCNLDSTLDALLEYIGYSTRNKNLTAILSQPYHTTDGHVLVSSNHTQIPNSKIQTHIVHSFGSGQRKRHAGVSEFTVCPDSKVQDLIILRVKGTST